MDRKNSGVYVLELKGGGYYVGKSNDVPKRVLEHIAGGYRASSFCKSRGGVARVSQPLTDRSDDLSAWETRETITQMVVHGFDNVRGAAYTNAEPHTAEELVALKREVFHVLDRCRRCGGAGHFAPACKRADVEPWLKNLDLMISTRSAPAVLPEIAAPAPAAAAARRRARASEPAAALPQPAKKARSFTAGSCSRCGRDSHAATSCYAKRDVDGNEISDPGRSAASSPSSSQQESSSSSRSGSCFRCGRDSHWVKDCYAKRDASGNEISDSD